MDAVEGWLFAGSAVMVVSALTILALALAGWSCSDLRSPHQNSRQFKRLAAPARATAGEKGWFFEVIHRVPW